MLPVLGSCAAKIISSILASIIAFAAYGKDFQAELDLAKIELY